jgi:hypothetical protein
MSRFYFDVRDNGELHRDEAGKDLPNLDGAIAHAIERYGGRLAGTGESGQEPSLRIEIRFDDDELPSYVLDAETASG